jgi:hypothetical protein
MLDLIGLIALYLVQTVPIYMIARKCGQQNAWMAFVPLANLWLLCDMAEMETWFLIIWLVPYVNVVFLAFVWWRIAENTNKPGWVGLLMLVPLVNLAAAWYIATAEGGRFAA